MHHSLFDQAQQLSNTTRARIALMCTREHVDHLGKASLGEQLLQLRAQLSHEGIQRKLGRLQQVQSSRFGRIQFQHAPPACFGARNFVSSKVILALPKQALNHSLTMRRHS